MLKIEHFVSRNVQCCVLLHLVSRCISCQMLRSRSSELAVRRGSSGHDSRNRSQAVEGWKVWLKPFWFEFLCLHWKKALLVVFVFAF